MSIQPPDASEGCLWTFQDNYWTVTDMCPAGKGCLDDFQEAILEKQGGQGDSKVAITAVHTVNGVRPRIQAGKAIFRKTVDKYAEKYTILLTDQQKAVLAAPDSGKTILLPCVTVKHPFHVGDGPEMQ